MRAESGGAFKADPQAMAKHIHRYIRGCGISGRWTTRDDIAALPVFKGAYLLVLRLAAGREIELPAGLAGRLDPGWYLYAGSALGPGGVQRRLNRHFKRDKKIHWHIDRLTTEADEIAALALPDGRECDLVARLAGSQHFATAIAGFGSSDCRRCQSHLLHPTDPA
jgi:Uri superfamily endonuclease